MEKEPCWLGEKVNLDGGLDTKFTLKGIWKDLTKKRTLKMNKNHFVKTLKRTSDATGEWSDAG